MEEREVIKRIGPTRGEQLFVPAVHPRYDAVFRQIPFAGFFLLSLVFLHFQVPEIASSPAFWLGILTGVSATVFSFFSSKLINEGDTWLTVVPLLDYLALMLISIVQPEVYLTPMVLLSVIPALWLGSIEKVYGFVIVIVMSFLTMLPSVVYHLYFDQELLISELLALLLIPTFNAVAAGTIHSMTLRSSLKERTLHVQEARLQRTVQLERESNRLLDSVIKAVGGGLFVIDQHGREILSNDLMNAHPLVVASQMNFKELERLGWYFAPDKTIALPDGDGPVARSLRGESFTSSLYWVGDPTNTEKFAISFTSRPLMDADGTFHGSVIAFQDVTTFMDALEAKDTFISTVSHELRTPLTSITGYLELIRGEEEKLPKDVLSYLDVTERNTQRLLLRVTDLLNVAQLEKGDLALLRKPTDLVTVLDEAIDAFAPVAKQKNITLTRVGLDSAVVTVDGARISQVCENLLSNGIKYTPAGGFVSLEIAPLTAGKGFRIIVTDSGMGISLEDQDQLFSRFFRAQAVRDGSIPGMGLGLSICKKIVESHGGTISLSSVPNQGTTVTVDLPELP